MPGAWLEIDLAAYRRNLRALREHTKSPIIAVVKANGYGHGMAEIARAAASEGCVAVAVARPEEGAELRHIGYSGRIVVLGVSQPDQAGLIVEHGLEPVVTREESLQALASAAGRDQPVRVHVKVDTGMTRAGVEPEEAIAFCRAVAGTQALLLAGVLTHFASADEPDLTSVQEQWNRFAPLASELSGWTPRPMLHAANSAGALRFPEARLDAIRPGLITYGVAPGPDPPPFQIEPVAALKARLVEVKEVPAGRAVSYGGTWRTERRSRLALAPLGYGDGLPWSLSNRGHALVRGSRVPIRGRVCMDQTILDVTEVPGAAAGDEAVFVGRQGAEVISIPELSALAGTIPYEILTGLAARLPRVFHAAALRR